MTKLDIINNALMKCGLPLAASLAEADYNAMHVYDASVESVLSAHAWSFARVYITPAEVTNSRGFGPTYAYKLPDNFVWLIDVRSQTSTNSPCGLHEVVGKTLYCDMRPAHVRCIVKTDESTWPADFAEAVATLIAAKIAGLSSEKMSLVAPLMNMYSLMLGLARESDSRSVRSRMPQDNPFTRARGEAGN